MSEINQTNPFSEETIQQKIDYKKEFLDIADNILKKKKDDEILNYDLDKFKQNIIESNTPKEALDSLENEQKLTGYIDFNDVKRDNIELSEKDVYLTIDQLLGINPISKMMFNV